MCTLTDANGTQQQIWSLPDQEKEDQYCEINLFEMVE